MKRTGLAWCLALVAVAQMVTGPAAHALAPVTPYAAGAAATILHPGAPAQQESPVSESAPHDGCSAPAFLNCACDCACGHTPPLGAPEFAPARPVPPTLVARTPPGPAFLALSYDFLRPPN